MEATGEGQYIDVSIQHSIISLTANAVPSWEMSSTILPRVGNLRGGVSPNIKQRQLWKCKDGYLNFWILGGGFGEKSNRALTRWMAEEGMSDAFIDSIDWHNFDQSKVKPEEQEHLEDMVAKFFMTHTKEELFQQAVERQISMAPVSNPKDILENLQLKDREFFINVKHDDLDRDIFYPGSFVKISSEPQITIRRRAPRIGEHNKEVFAELNINHPQTDSQ
jgi:benzylsuccinate CoA-transferase BbsE subunit/naphthyl-2-methylsuccinate CoA transferase subunit